MNNSANNLFTAVDMILDHKLQNAKFDTSAIAVVLRNLESEANSNKYEIRYEDSVLEAYAAEGVKYNKGDAVFVLFAQNRLEANNWILGAAHSARLALEKSELIDVNYLDVGETIVTDQPSKEEDLIKIINQDSRIILWDANAASNKITIDATAFRSYASQGNFIKVAAEFQTEDLEGNGNYGLEVIITEDGVERKLVLDTALMIGNFYNFSYPSKQVDVFTLGSKDVRIKQVALFTKGFTNGSVTVSNINIKVAQESANSAKNQIEMELLAPSGNIFIEGSESIENGLQLRAWLVKNEKPIINNLECYWFKQNPAIQTGNEKFHVYGGPGWELLNNSNNGVLDTNDLVYQVGINEVNSKSALFKAVIIFEGNKFQSVITIYNGTEESSSINIINAQNQLECRVEPSNEEYLYQWYRVDASGHWAPIKGATGAILAISPTAAGSFGCAVNQGEKYIGFASTEIYGEIDDIKDFKIEYAYGDSNTEPPSGAQEIAIGDNLRGKTVVISAEYLEAYQEDDKTFFKAADYIIDRSVYWQAYSANGDWGDNGGDQSTLNVGGNYDIPNTLHVFDSGSIAPTEYTFPNDRDYIVTIYSSPLLTIKYFGDGEWSLTQPTYQADKYLWQRVTKTYLDGKVEVTYACIDSPSTDAYVINMSNDTVVISGEPTEDALKTLTENIVTVWYGSKDITEECSFLWGKVGATGVTNEKGNISYLTSLESDNAQLTVDVSLNGDPIGSMAQTISRVHDGQPGASAVNYKLIVSPNMINWSKTEEAVTVTFQVLKITDKSEDITNALGANGLKINFNGNTISGVEKEIPYGTGSAYFELVSTDGLVRDREDISIVQDGQDGKDGAPGADGKDGETGPQGPQGATGENGKDGISFVGIIEYYYATNNIDDIPNESTTWSTTPNAAGYSENKKYLWNYEVVKLSDNSSSSTAPALISVWGTDGAAGKDGSYPTDFISYYAIHDNGTTPPSPQPTEDDVVNQTQTVGSWSRTPTAAAQGEYLWEKMFTVIYSPTEKKNTYVAGTPTVIGYSGTNGDDGKTPYIQDGEWYLNGVSLGVKAKGEDGAPGSTPYIGEDGYWYIDNQKLVKAEGKDGDTPRIEGGYWYIGETATGIKAEGQDGAPGATPYINDQGYWCIGTTVTNIKAAGSNGKPGDSTVSIELFQNLASAIPAPTKPTTPNDTGWSTTKPNSYQYLFSCLGLKTTVYNADGSIASVTYYFEDPQLVAINGKSDAFVAQYNQYLKFTQNGEKDIMQWDGDELYVKASVLAVGDSANPEACQFYASDKSNTVYIAGFGVGECQIGTSGEMSPALYYGIDPSADEPVDDGDFIIAPSGIYNNDSIAGSDSGKYWRMILGTNFGIDTSGILYASGANISGTISATKGYIGGWTIGTKAIYDGTTAGMLQDGVGSHTTDLNYNSSSVPVNGYLRFYAGSKKSSADALVGNNRKSYKFDEIANFYITSKGYLYSSYGNIAGLNIGQKGDGLALYTFVNEAAPLENEGDLLIAPSGVTIEELTGEVDNLTELYFGLGNIFTIGAAGQVTCGSINIKQGSTIIGRIKISGNSIDLQGNWLLNGKAIT